MRPKGEGWKRYAVAFLLPLVLFCSCGRREEQLTVSAAADLTEAFGEIGRRFRKETGVAVSFNFGSTGQLARQIEQGAPVDVFAAANVIFIEELERQGLILAETRRIYGRGRIAIWSRGTARRPPERLEDLRQPWVRRIAIANPEHAPYGMAAREAIESAGLLAELSPRLVPGENVRQALQYAETENVEAAIVARSLCREGVGRWTLIPAELHRPLNQALAVIRTTKHREAAIRFAEFVTSDEGQEILGRYGFEPVPLPASGSVQR